MKSAGSHILVLLIGSVAHCAQFDSEPGYLGLMLNGGGGGGGGAATAIPADWHLPDWSSRRVLTFDNSAQTTSFSSFPVLIALDSTRIDYDKTQNSGQDLRFIDSTGVAIEHEIEQWNESGTSTVWVNVTGIDAASSSDLIYMYYDNASASDGQNASGTWNTDYKGVWHLNSALTDSSSTGNNGTNNGSTDTSGVIQNGRNFDGTSQYFSVGTDLNTWLGQTFTVAVWLRTTQTGNATYWQAPGVTGIEENGGSDDVFIGWLSNTGTLSVM